MDQENNCLFVSSRGILKSCDIYSAKPISSVRHLVDYDFTQIKTGSTVYICSRALPQFISIYKEITSRFILITGDCDESCPVELFNSHQEFLDFIESDNIIHWFSQNCVNTSHPKLSQIPIGLDYHTLSIDDHAWGNRASPTDQEKLLTVVKSKSEPFWKRKIHAYSNFHFLMTTKFGQDRKDAQNQIPNYLVYYEPEKIKRLNTWVKQTEYAFVISPHGNGMDCHRTWEALILGCIPIIKTSPLDKMFQDLPVLIVKTWTDVTLPRLNKTVRKFKKKTFNYDKLNLKYWKDIIESVRPSQESDT